MDLPSPTPQPARRPPGPRGAPLLGCLREMQKDPLTFLVSQARAHGDVVQFPIGPRRITLLVGPDAIRHVLQDNARGYDKQTPGFNVVRELLGQGLLTSEGDFWLRQRRLAQPAFHRQRLASFAHTMASEAQTLAEALLQRRGQGPFDVAEGLSRLALRVASLTLFGAEMDEEAAEVGRVLPEMQELANARIMNPLSPPRALPTPGNRRADRAIATLDRVVHGIIAERRKQGADARADLLSLLMEAQDADTGERMSDVQLRDEVMTLLLAGHETSASGLTWAVALLSRHPDVRRRLQQEAAEVCAGGRLPGVEDLPRLAYTRRVVDEVLRLFPPAWIFSRSAIAADTVAGYALPARSLVLLSPYVTHRHPGLWDNPEGFDPERFLPERERERPRFAYFPFGGGPRLCIGNQFALMEMVLVLATLATRVRLDLEPGRPFFPGPAITLRPRPGVWVTAREA
ncbi:cytochrome P450 [Aggregicoccus sp. 17bor-14]|uniref:cytochrome P450 n=1 Tax=Myxococcaceae TaxID=31 RepID=UPI00129CB212|nr:MULTISPECIES: cytochrome P450 [Myxococcaceae]MBF5042914.1 cytochrome P450 [Simulacricoccus sp. 17bor-14]MRI88681.1 cytochrome P450 [Aggregicoccus sp. 17bor-14]